MKKLIFIFFIISFSILSKAQDFYFINRATDFMWYGLNNLIQIEDNIEKSNLIIKAKNGNISNILDSAFMVKPTNYGWTTLSIYQIQKNDTIKIAEKIYKVKPFPQATATINGGINNDSISKQVLCSQFGIQVSVYNYDIDVNYEPVSYEVMIIQQGYILHSEKYTGNKFNDELKNVFQVLEKGDRVFIYNIISKDQNGENHKEGQINLIIR